jgi:hypothetical protein
LYLTKFTLNLISKNISFVYCDAAAYRAMCRMCPVCRGGQTEVDRLCPPLHKRHILLCLICRSGQTEVDRLCPPLHRRHNTCRSGQTEVDRLCPPLHRRHNTCRSGQTELDRLSWTDSLHLCIKDTSYCVLYAEVDRLRWTDCPPLHTGHTLHIARYAAAPQSTNEIFLLIKLSVASVRNKLCFLEMIELSKHVGAN